MLTEKQIDVIASGIRSRWSKPGLLEGVRSPSYTSTLSGNADRGAADLQDLLRILATDLVVAEVPKAAPSSTRLFSR